MSGKNIKQKLLDLKPRRIDSTKCTQQKSLYEQIQRSKQARRDHQDKQWFNLGNGQTFNDPINAAEYLLEREYGDTFLFKADCHDPVFIPSEFMSKQYFKDSPVLDFDIEEQARITLENLKQNEPNLWFTKALEDFIKTQTTGAVFNDKDFEKWKLNCKVLYLMVKELNDENLNLSSTTSEHFLDKCIDLLYNCTPYSDLKRKLTDRKVKALVNQSIEKNPPTDPRVHWFFDLQLSERGEKLERDFFEKLLEIKTSPVLKDIVILSSMEILTHIPRKMHQEFDYLIISYSRKLIIGMELKRNLNSNTAFEQLIKYQAVFEERLADQLGNGWTFHPVLCVEKDQFSCSSRHYINIADTDIESWLEKTTNRYLEVPLKRPLVHMKYLLQIIVFTVHISKKDQLRPITTSYWDDYVTEVINTLSTVDNIVFYSSNQLPVMTSNDPKYNKLLILGGFGSGKTFLLQEKAILLSKKAEFKNSVLYMVCSGHGLLYHERSLELGHEGITVFPVKQQELDGLVRYSKPKMENLKRRIVKGKYKCIFFDEWSSKQMLLEMGLPGTIMNTLLFKSHLCWIAPGAEFQEKINDPDFKILDHLGDFEKLILSTNLRNSKEVVNKSQLIAEETLYRYTNGLLPPAPNFPNGCQPAYPESIEEAVFLARLGNPDRGILVIVSTLESLQTITNVKFFHFGKNDFRSRNPVEYLRQGNVLITAPQLVTGFEWHTVVYKFDENQQIGVENHECNLVMRCTTRLFIVTGQSHPSTKNQTFPYNDIMKMVDTRNDDSDNKFLLLFKKHTRKLIIDYFWDGKERERLYELSDVLQETLANFTRTECLLLTKEEILRSLEKFLIFFITSGEIIKTETQIALELRILQKEFLNKNSLSSNSPLKDLGYILTQLYRKTSLLATLMPSPFRFLSPLKYDCVFLVSLKMCIAKYIIDLMDGEGDTDELGLEGDFENLTRIVFNNISCQIETKTLSKYVIFQLVEIFFIYIIESHLRVQGLDINEIHERSEAIIEDMRLDFIHRYSSVSQSTYFVFEKYINLPFLNGTATEENDSYVNEHDEG
ncbi:uncharacterized protein [Clytia hemisphaerica]|uniref:uncharacterized protein n=1 Tax=Clytia hemisphaerica TaxID=252671 RepID=UPI0034D47202